MPKRNSQYILTTSDNDEVKSFERLTSYFNLQFLNHGKLEDIDLSINNVSEGNTTPTDLALKTYVQNIDSEIKSDRKYIGEIENCYGIYSSNTVEGINHLIKANGNLLPSTYADSNYPLNVKINNKDYSFTSISVNGSGIVPNLFHMWVKLAPNEKFGTEESRYLKELEYEDIHTYGDKKYYILRLGSDNSSEYSTVRVDRVNHKLIFEHPGGAYRSQWFPSNNVLVDPMIISSIVNTFDLLEIRYVFIRHNEGSDEHACSMFYYNIDPVLIRNPEELRATGSETYGYNVNDGKWYRFKPREDIVSEESIQLVGMIGIDVVETINPETQEPVYTHKIVCSYTVPNYFQKAQYNTLKLERYREKIIRTKSSSNVINVGNNMIETKQYYYEWNFDGRSYKNQTIFLYIDQLGNTKVSPLRPYRNEYGGYYLNNKLWRCVGSVFVNNSYELNQPCDLLGSFNSYETYKEKYNSNTYARFPLNYKGKVKLVKSYDESAVLGEYDAEDLNYGINVLPSTTIIYEGRTDE